MTYMAGIYLVSFATEDLARSFVERFKCCPLWPIVSKVTERPDVLIIAREIAEQEHGDFSENSNTLAEHPELLGALQVKFRRDDGLLKFFAGQTENYGMNRDNPCGTDCDGCPRLDNPCRGCVANIKYWSRIDNMNNQDPEY